MVDEATLQAPLDAELNAHLAAGRAIYYGDRRLAAGVIKEYPDGRCEAVAFDAQGNKRVLRTTPPLPASPLDRLCRGSPSLPGGC